MDPELFKQRLEEFAELKQMKVPRAAGRAEATEPEIIERGGQSFAIELKDNPTIGWEIKKLKPKKEICSDCDKLVTDRVLHFKVCSFPFDHWRASCKNCAKTQDPDTGRFTLTAVAASNVYTNHLKQNRSESRVLFRKPAK
jgi:hypothetical protein